MCFTRNQEKNLNQLDLYHQILSNWSRHSLHYRLYSTSDVLTGCVVLASLWLQPHKKDVDPSTWPNRLAVSHWNFMLSCPAASFFSFGNCSYIQKQNSSIAEQPDWKWGRNNLAFSWEEEEGYFWDPTRRGFICLKENRGTLFLKWIKKWTTERDNIRKLVLSLAELANSQERSDDSSIVNNYHFVIKRRGKCSGPFLKLRLCYRSTHTLWKKCLAPWVFRLVPTTPACSRFVLSCVTTLHFGGERILFILVFLNWAGNQHNIALLCEFLYLSLQVISLYSVDVWNPHILLVVSKKCLL